MAIENQIAKLGLTETSMEVDGVFLEEAIPGLRIVSVSGRGSMENNIDELDIPSRPGSIYRYKKLQPRTITVAFNLTCGLRDTYNKSVDKIFNLLRGKNMKIAFADLYDRYYIGNVKNIEIGEAAKMTTPPCYASSGTISIYCSDPYAYAKGKKIATNNRGRTVVLQNDGNCSTVVDVSINMLSDNGYVGLTLGDRFYQIGKPEEVDGNRYEKTEMLFDDHLYEDKGWLVNQGVTPPVTPVRDQNGTIKYVKEYENEGYATTADYKTGSSWHGASLTKIVPKGSDNKYAVNWRSDFRYDFNTAGSANKGIEVGHNSVTWSDADGNIICSVVFEDNNPSSESSDMYIYVEENRVMAIKNAGKKFYDTQRGGSAVRVEKIGNKISVGFSAKGISKSYTLQHPERELRKITWYGAAYQTRTRIRNNLIRAANVYKHNVEHYDDIPNYFGNGDVVVIDGTTGEVRINDVFDMDVTDIGSQPLVLEPGQHSLGIAISSFATMPDVTVTYQERWL